MIAVYDEDDFPIGVYDENDLMVIFGKNHNVAKSIISKIKKGKRKHFIINGKKYPAYYVEENERL